MRLSLVLLLMAAAVDAAAPMRAGAARLRITPQEPIWMAGYAARTHPSTGVAMDLWAKALAVEDASGGRVVIITMDLLRVPRVIIEPVAREVKRRFGLERSQLLFNCSHNHSGPSLWENDPFTALTPAEYEKCRRYTEGLTEGFVNLIGEALKNLAPARILTAAGEASFGANRRVPSAKGYQIAYNAAGVADHRVPVIEVVGQSGKVIAILFGYACHNTTVGPGTYQISADYAGFAQAEIERTHAGSTALFLELCGGDQDPHPRGGLEVAERHGKELAASVERVLEGKLRRVSGRVRTRLEQAELPFAAHTRAMFETRLTDPMPARVRNARAMLRAYDEGKPVRTLTYPVQAIGIGRDLAMVALGGEPVVDYALRAQRQFPGVIVAGYSNEVRSYIPSARVIGEGGYEAEESMLYYGLPGPYTRAVEDTIFSAMARALKAVGR